jgi:Domain of unknown function (DUF4410)
MSTIPVILIAPGLIFAAITPAKVTDGKTNASAVPVVKPPSVIYVKSFSIANAATSSEQSAEMARPHLLGRLRGGEENTVIGQYREQQQEDTLAKVPEVLQNALIADLSGSIAPGANGDAMGPARDCWVVTGEFVEVDTGNRALQAGVGFGAGSVNWRCTLASILALT